MKANEAPEKIYIPNNPAVISAAYSSKTAFNDVEYIRTDAFIEKAVEFLSKEANLPLWEGRNGDFGCDTVLLVKNFKKYMKGE